jgi:3-deoxy-D-manno-octulosonic-acid transferase
VQGEETSRRLLALGAQADRLTVTGSVKFDAVEGSSLPGRGRERVLRFFRMSPQRLVFVAGSTHEGEEEAVVRAFNRVRSTPAGANALLILAARHPQRFDEVERLCRDEGLSTIRRSELPIDAEPRADAVIVDTIGELAALYQVATAVFMGGSLVSKGGHNILEPAACGKPIVFGPHMENFNEIARTFLSNDAAVQVRSARELEHTLLSLMGDPVRRARLGAAARALIDANRGAKERTLAVIAELLPPHEPPRFGVVRPFRLVH